VSRAHLSMVFMLFMDDRPSMTEGRPWQLATISTYLSNGYFTLAPKMHGRIRIPSRLQLA
jgi:hypothetical protein